MTHQNSEILEEIVSTACLSLFDDYKLPLVRIKQGALRGDVPLIFCGVVGFNGDQMRGTLLLATSEKPLGATTPSTDSSLQEWIAELANQLLGRIKNRLLSRAVTLHLTTPIVLRGQHIAPVSHAELVPYTFECAGGYVCVWLDAEVAANIDLSTVVATDDVIGEGMGTMF
jgi:hypothetical protein